MAPDAMPSITAAPPAGWTPTPALTAALARLLLALARGDCDAARPAAAETGVAK
jgi:hypothetical protein